MLLFPFARRSLLLGSLLLGLASCGTTQPVADDPTPTPNAADLETDPSATPTVPPGQLDRDADGKNAADGPIEAAPNATVRDGVRVLSCQTTGGLVNDPNGPLNIRSEPDASADNVVGTVPDGAPVSIVGERDNWWQLDAPTAGWVSQNLVESYCNEKIARIELPPNADSVTLRDRFVGTGYHHYQLDARAGQRLTIEAIDDSPLPFVLTPDDRDLTEGAPNAAVALWSGQLPADGDYTLVFDSNFRGYAYEVEVEVR